MDHVVATSIQVLTTGLQRVTKQATACTSPPVKLEIIQRVIIRKRKTTHQTRYT